VTSSNERFDENTRSATEVGEPQDTVAPDQPERLEETEASPMLQDEPIEAQDADAAVDEPVDPERELADETPTDLVAELAAAKQDLAERTTDLQRLQAEYVNYKRRVDRDREVVRRHGIESVLRDLLSVLDDIRSAREHEGELSGGFKAVAEAVERVASKYGLEAYGAKGDPFDPHIHEALMHAHAEGITGPTCVEILQPGYRVQDKVLRPARVAVAEPDPNATAATEAADTAAEATATDAQPTDVSQ
jgi:molecular chaperone GrpE